MHVPKQFKETNKNVLHALIRRHPLATWVTSKDDELDVNHIPFVLDTTQGEYGVLKGHVNKANPVWQSLPTAKKSIAVFQGADSYITPSWYPSKQEHGKVVPTWNYVVVHAHGFAKCNQDEAWLLEHLNALTNQQESGQEEPWKVSDAPEPFIKRMLNSIVGIEIPICTIDGTWKTSQNKSTHDKTGVIEGLIANHNPMSNAMAQHVSQHTVSQHTIGTDTVKQS